MFRAVSIFTLLAWSSSVTAILHAGKTTGYFQAEHTNPNAYNHSFSHFDCGTDASQASDHFLATVNSLHQTELQHGAAGSGPAAAVHAVRANTQLAVPLYMHVVTTNAHAHMVTPAQMTQQLKTLNTAYNAIGITFVLKNTSWTVNDAWAVGSSATDDSNMKVVLRQGTYSSLNLYFQSDLANGVLGKCQLPTNAGTQSGSTAYMNDGCNIALGTVPNGPIQGFNMGKTAVHETGHWLGLLHTFEGYSCTGTGDFIADTAVESQSTNGCPTSPWKNSCPQQRSGGDPIHNYMDYSTDACYTKFTPGQQARIQTLWKQYRQGY